MNEFKLPEKWYVKPNNIDEARILAKYFDDNKCGQNWNYSEKPETVLNLGLCKGYGYHKSIFSTTITFEQFKTYVLEEEFKVGDWVIANGIDHTKDNEYFPLDVPFKILKIEENPYDEKYALVIVDKTSTTVKGMQTNINSIRKATQEEIDAVTKKEYTIEDLSNGKCAVINDGTVEELRLLLKAAFPKCNVHINGMYKYYTRSMTVPHYWVFYNNTHLPTQSVQDFLKQLKQINMENKEIIGYNLIKPEYHTACNAILGSLYLMKDESGIYFYQGSVQYNIFNKAGILNLWFEPVYKETSKIFKMQSASGVFELEVSSKGIYYKPEDVYLDIPGIEGILLNADFISPIKTNKSSKYNIKFNKVDVGCKKDTLISEWEQAYNYYKSLV